MELKINWEFLIDTYLSSLFSLGRVKLIIEGIEKEESLLLEDLASMDRKFAEHYNVSLHRQTNFLNITLVASPFYLMQIHSLKSVKIFVAVQTSKVLEQILAVLIQFVKDKKLEHQHQYVRLFHAPFILVLINGVSTIS